MVGGRVRVLVKALRDILDGEEVTVHYESGFFLEDIVFVPIVCKVDRLVKLVGESIMSVAPTLPFGL